MSGKNLPLKTSGRTTEESGLSSFRTLSSLYAHDAACAMPVPTSSSMLSPALRVNQKLANKIYISVNRTFTTAERVYTVAIAVFSNQKKTTRLG